MIKEAKLPDQLHNQPLPEVKCTVQNTMQRLADSKRLQIAEPVE